MTMDNGCEPSRVYDTLCVMSDDTQEDASTSGPRDNQDTTAFARLARMFFPHATLLRSWPLQGGVSARMTALEIAHSDGQTQTLVARQHGPADLARNPHIARDEFRLLVALHSAGLPAPMPYGLDTSGKLFDTPVIVIEYIEGETNFASADPGGYLRQFAAQLTRIHQVDATAFDLAFLPRQEETWASIIATRPERLDESLQEGRIRDALEAVWPWTPRNPLVLLHGDYWPGNVLWRDGRLAGVIDWEDAALGDPLADIAISRLEILWAFGVEAMDSFTDYRAARTKMALANLPYWDLCAALRPAGRLNVWASNSAAEVRMRERHRLFVAQAFARL